MSQPHDALMLSHIAQSNIPVQEKSLVMRMASKYGLTGASAAVARAKKHAIAGGEALRIGGESAMVGGILGAAAVYLPTGLDFEVKHKGVLKASVPVDAVVGALALGASVELAGEAASADLRNAGGAALAVFSYRKTQDFLAEKMLARSGSLPIEQRKVPGFLNHKQDTALAAQQRATSSAHGEDGDVGEDPIVSVARSFRQ